MEYIHHYHSPLGGITMASDGEVLTGLWFDGQKYFAVTLAKEHEEKMLPVFEETDRWLDIYFQGKEPDFLPPVSFASGSEFRQEVWKILLSIPYGKTMTYGEIAACIVNSGDLPGCQHRQWAARLVIIRYLLSCHVTEWWERMEV